MEGASAQADKPLRRLLAYMRLAPGGYVLGGVLTLLYAVFFQLIPLAIRDIVAAFEDGACRSPSTSLTAPAISCRGP